MSGGVNVVKSGLKGEKRPADASARAVKIVRVLTGEEPEDYGNAPARNQAAAELGRAVSNMCAESMTPERLAEIAKKAAVKRWGKT